jgi:hypothetical protein
MSEGGGGWSPMICASSQDPEDARWWLEQEVGELERAVRERGELGRRDLRRAAQGRRWGPGRFGAALQEAVRRGAVSHPRRGRYGPPSTGVR